MTVDSRRSLKTLRSVGSGGAGGPGVSLGALGPPSDFDFAAHAMRQIRRRRRGKVEHANIGRAGVGRFVTGLELSGGVGSAGESHSCTGGDSHTNAESEAHTTKEASATRTGSFHPEDVGQSGLLVHHAAG